MRDLARLLAIGIAVAGVWDPALACRVRQPVQVDVRLPPVSAPEYQRAVAARDALSAALGDRVSLLPSGDADAVVAIGNAAVEQHPGAPVLALDAAPPPALRFARVETPQRALLGQRLDITALLRGRGLGGRTTRIQLWQQGVAVASTSHTWGADDESFEASLAPVAPGPGLHSVRLTATTEGIDDAVADTAVALRDMRLRTLVYEPRPSWMSLFVRRALETDPLFDVATVVNTSTGVTVTSAGAPQSLGAKQLTRFDAVVVGAPDALSAGEWDALLEFADERGGSIVVLPDRPLPAAAARRLGLGPLDEVLLQRPATARLGELTISASELLLPRDTAGLQSIATVVHDGVSRPAIVTSPRGEGLLVFAGLLDAWRFRADGSGQAESVWRALVADAAAMAPPLVQVTVAPALARPDEEVVVRVTVRPTEFDRGAEMRVPAVDAALVGDDGTRRMIRLWPAGRAGRFEGRIAVGRAGRFLVSASAGGHRVDAPLAIDPDVIHASAAEPAASSFAVTATAGATFSDLEGLADHLSTMSGGFAEVPLRPVRSPWAAVAFALLLTMEWASRRKSGLP